jgi:hypothetical protein
VPFLTILLPRTTRTHTTLKSEPALPCVYPGIWRRRTTDAGRRVAYLPGIRESVQLELVACAMMRNPHWRLIHLVPVTDGVTSRYPTGLGES